MRRRTLGVGVINYAYYLAKTTLNIPTAAPTPLTHKPLKAMQYYLLKASNQLAKEQGACEAFSDTLLC